MVQLKLFNDRFLLTQAVCFNSCMVQLKSDTAMLEEGCLMRFNSCMVQLKYGIELAFLATVNHEF